MTPRVVFMERAVQGGIQGCMQGEWSLGQQGRWWESWESWDGTDEWNIVGLCYKQERHVEIVTSVLRFLGFVKNFVTQKLCVIITSRV
jgi:hypothetical protein